ncbi:SNARE domain-containing protein, putative [Eimeria tenella]|uniref:SNARE domain-containing protein, putative n=1 Tax=Eimeria tenella TaxID=5802 RepID=U6KVR3_EIMTE|nr:SNARE domain-containing protein, putative [Eimeria tenella]CDJ42061.1 SNARE domain-containing protein, putative [Eimeria tenella]|eukprot:XP_013232811.1 SNARE domain-containing protein, putative [Eimeria tenella]
MECDLWASDAAKLKQLQQTVDSLLQRARTDPAAATGEAAAVLRGHVTRMAQRCSQLEQSLMRASESPELFGLSAAALQQRLLLLQQLQQQQDAQLEAFRLLFSQAGVYRHSKKESFNSNFSDFPLEDNSSFLEETADTPTSASADDFGSFGPSPSVSGSSLLQQPQQQRWQQQQQQQQDEEQQEQQLSYLAGSVMNLKEISYAISDEVSVHRRLLDATESSLDTAEANLKKNKKMLQKLMKRHSTICLLLVALALLCLLIFLLVFTA